MAKSREIKRRIKAVGNIRRITKTMQMIATARFQAAQRRVTASKPYSSKIAELVGELAQAAGGDEGIEHPLLSTAGRKPANKQLVLVITSNRGLCGGYNANTLRTAVQFLRDHKGTQIDLEVVGKKGQAFFKFTGQPVSQFHAQFGDNPAFELVKALAEKYMAAFSAGTYDAVSVVFMSYISMSRQTPSVKQLLPLENPAQPGTASSPPPPPEGGGGKAAPGGKVQYDFTPDAATLLNELLPITVEAQLFQCFNEAVVGEQIARMVAMKAATDSAGKMGKTLSRRYNRARQAAITTELSEIIAGAAGLE